jgi:hypothetical protein
MIRALLSRIGATIRRKRVEQEFDDEVQVHIDLLAERFVRSGMSAVDANYAARRQFGGVGNCRGALARLSCGRNCRRFSCSPRHRLRWRASIAKRRCIVSEPGRKGRRSRSNSSDS